MGLSGSNAIRVLSAICCAAACAAWAGDVGQHVSPPRDYSGRVRLYDVPLTVPPPDAETESEPKVPDRGPASSGGSIFPSTEITPPSPQATPRRNMPPPDKERKQTPWWESTDSQGLLKDDARPSGWGWLADDVLKAKARRTAAEAEQAAESDNEDENAYVSPDSRRTSDSNSRYRGSGTNDTSVDRAAADSRSVRLGEQRPTIESIAGEQPTEDPWTLGPTLWGDGDEIGGSRDLGNVSLLSAPSVAPMGGADLSTVRSALSGASVEDASPSSTSPKLPLSTEHSTLFTPVSSGLAPAGSEQSLWGGSDLGSSLGALPLSPVQDTVTPPPTPTTSLTLPSATPSTPSLGGMGTEGDQVRPKALPW